MVKHLKKIKYKNNIYEYDGETQNYCSPINMIWDFLIGKDIVALLNDEVEIIEEDKKIEKLDIDNDTMVLNGYEIMQEQLFEVSHKVNELIDEINNLKD